MHRAFFSNTLAPLVNRLLALTACLLLTAQPAHAQLSVEIGGAGSQQYPIAVLGFTGDASADAVIATVRSDLSKSGLFRVLPDVQKVAAADTPDIAALRSAGADAASWGTIVRVGNRYELKLQIHDTVRNTVIDNAVMNLGGEQRYAGHQIADRIYEKITGFKGFFTSRLVYVTKLGAESRELRVADWDGQFPQPALRSRESIMSPSFSPDASKLAYVSFESRKATIYLHDVATGSRNPLADYRGSNSAPSFAPDGASLVAALSLDGLAQIYSLDLQGSSPRRLTQSSGIDTEPAYSADGASIYFVSNRGGSPQIYRMPASGTVGGIGAQRVTFNGDYNVSPAVSPDGKWLTYIALRSGRKTAAVLSLSNQQETLLSDSGEDESPSFTSNSQFVIYASRQKGRGVLQLASVDGKVRSTLSLPSADISDPAFSSPIR
jgi:TolB protein